MTTQQPEALRLANVCSNLTRYSMEAHLIAAELRLQHARIAELEAQLSAISAGGVSGPLMGRAPLAASAGSEPVIGWHAFPHDLQHPDGRLLRTASDLLARHGYQGCAEPLRAMSDVLLPTHPSPPEGMVGGWMPIETAPKDGTRILLHPAVEVHDAWSKGYWSEQHECWIVGGSASGVTHTYWLPLPPTPPTTSAGSGKGE